MSHFKYLKEKLFIEKVSVLDIARKNRKKPTHNIFILLFIIGLKIFKKLVMKF